MVDVKVLEQYVDEGLIRSIGLSNFNSQQIQYVIDHGRIPPAVLQVTRAVLSCIHKPTNRDKNITFSVGDTSTAIQYNTCKCCSALPTLLNTVSALQCLQELF